MTGFPTTLLQSNSYNNSNSNSKKRKNTYSKQFAVETLVPSAVFLARNFLSPSECSAWIKYAEEEIGFEQMCSPQTSMYAQRECGRISRNDWTMAKLLYNRMKDMVIEISNQVVVSNTDPTYGPVNCNGNLRLYRYEKGMSFGRHFDGSNKIDRYSSRNGNGYTEITVLVYLTSCQGGATRFHLPHSSSSYKKKSSGGGKKSKKGNSKGGSAASAAMNMNDQDRDGVSFEPEAGAILMHLHGDRCLEHEADPVIDGVKYVLRTDIVYAPSS
eukprot:CAMPEP_0194119220 /NCGR_PEP_ID=MMETSP0150-20130528/38459_1 /TAXON_ID=122233 /ORGANISM="Chaetoceros debilis, Strain MM31A-1" /LENGTH=270 /DNA_ID=CAMNT_0038810853 /DNA_START=95 /DNA_END=907 /DNA_ORIENTATION=+